MEGSLYSTCDISVVVPAFNEEKHIERCLRSLNSQENSGFTVTTVVVDDKSTDRTASLVEKYFPECLLVKKTRNSGLPASLNEGIQACSSQYVVRVDADDFVDRKFLDLLYLTISTNPGVHAVSCDYYLVDADGQRISRRNASEAPIGCGIIFQRDVLVELGLYDEDFLAREEEELMIRFKNGGYKILHLPLPLYRYRQHGSSITKNHEVMSEYKKKLDDKHA